MCETFSNTSRGHDPRAGDGHRRARMRVESILLLILLAIALAGSLLVTCPPAGQWRAGLQAWSEGSWLKSVVDTLSLEYQVPTQRGVEVKSLIFRWSACAIAVVAALLWLARTLVALFRPAVDSSTTRPWVDDQRRPSSDANGHRIVVYHADWGQTNQLDDDAPTGPSHGTPHGDRTEIDRLGARLVGAAQWLLIAYVLWAAMSTGWSAAPQLAAAFAATVVFLPLLAVPLGRRLGRRGTIAGVTILVVTAVLAAALGIGHHVVRAPGFRLGYPLGNPLPLAAILSAALIFTGGALLVGLGGLLWPAPPPRWASLLRKRSRVPAVLWVIVLAGTVVGLAWAIVLTGSRGALVGLAGGCTLGFIAWLARRGWRTACLGGMVAVVLVGAGVYGLVQLSERSASIRFRKYAWRYAIEMVKDRPIGGDGGGTYTRLAPGMAKSDQWRDPAAVPQRTVAHAHNEWLETAADLGVVGVLLWGGCWLLTVVALLRRWRRESEPHCGGAVVLGLACALTAIALEEATNVGLRLPGLPVVVAALLGLAWAACSAGWRLSAPTAPTRLGWHLLAAVAVVGLAGLGARLAWVDWLAERAHYEATATGSPADPDILRGRLDPARRLIALHYRLGTLTGQVADLRASDQLDLAEATAKDAADEGAYLARIAPGFGYVDALMADLAEAQAAIAVGRNDEASADEFRQRAKGWLEQACRRDRTDGPSIVKLLAYMPSDEMPQAVGMMRDVLRGGPLDEDVIRALTALATSDAFAAAVDALVVQAKAAADSDAPEQWVDLAVPETFRLAAIAAAVRGQFDAADALAGRSAELYAHFGGRFDVAHATVLRERADYQFRVAPDTPERAVTTAQAALAALLDSTVRSNASHPIRQDLAMYLLASGETARAGDELLSLQQTFPPDRRLGRDELLNRTWTSLLTMWLGVPADGRPTRFDRWLAAADQAGGQSVGIQLVFAELALERGDGPAAALRLDRARQLPDGPQQVAQFAIHASRRYPDSPVLKPYQQPDN